MRMYHSSNVAVKFPDTIHSREYLDFGKGFYLTTLRDQAVKYAQRFIRRKQDGWLNTYEFTFDASIWKVLRFDSYNYDWLDFVAKCRAGNDNSDFDIVIGGIADDEVIRTLDRFFAGELSANEAIGQLKYKKPNIQYCIRSQRLLDECVKHIESTKL